MNKTEYGIQMYSLRDVTQDDLKEALRMVADMGYKYIEFAGFFENSAEDVKAWLDEYGLICSGTHTGAALLTEDKLEETIAYHKTIGCKNLIIPGMDWSTKEKLDANIDLMNRVQKVLEENGITLGYHNHSSEFLETPYGAIIENEIIERTNVELQIDTFWLFNAGIEPIAYCEKLKDRIRVIHLKDGIPTAAENRNFRHNHDGVLGKSIGEGKAPISAVREWAMQNDVLMVIESEGLDPSGPLEVKRCIDFLKNM